MVAVDLGSRYEYIRELGSGGMGRVMLVRDLHLGKQLALKLLHGFPAGPDELIQFQREFALLASIEHPGVARAYDFGYAGERPFYTSEFIPGTPLAADSFAERGLGILEIAIEIARPLAFLHQSEVLHLDIKPGNIIVPLKQETSRPGAVLIDFGLFRRGLRAGADPQVRGSLPYMAPECMCGGRIGPWSDVYAFGVTLFRLTTNSFPRPEGRLLDRAGKAIPTPVPSFSREVAASLPIDFRRIVLKCLAVDPMSRFPSAAEVLETLERSCGSHGVSIEVRSAAAVPTAGRSMEIRKVEEFLRGVEEKQSPPPALLVTAQSGMGQSHLFRELQVRAQTRGLRCYLERGFPGSARPPGSVLRSLTIHVGDRGSPARARWEGFFAALKRPRRATREVATDVELRSRRISAVQQALCGLRDPLILAVDGLQFWDETSITLLSDLARWLAEQDASGRPPIGLVVGYREEGPCADLLRELSDQLLADGRGASLTLGPLDIEETALLYGKLRGKTHQASRGLGIYQASGGSPARIVGLALGRDQTSPTEAMATVKALRPDSPALEHTMRELLLVLDLMGRPARSRELQAILGLPSRRCARALKVLLALGLVARAEPDPGNPAWTIEVAGSAVSSSSKDQRRALHARIARGLTLAARNLPEAVRHFQAAGMRGVVAARGLEAARMLKANLQNREALAMYRLVFASLPASKARRRLEAALEAADLHCRVGDIDVGIAMLVDLLGSCRDLSRSSRARAVLRLAVLHFRRGDFQRAALLFREGFSTRAPLSLEEVLSFLNEEAALKVVLGKHDDALEICRRGLGLAERRRSHAIREVTLNLHATRANVALRRYDYESARDDLETALHIAESIGSFGNQATVLNNLGVVHSQCDRYAEAVRAFHEAERICLKVDEGPSLASVHGNLAMVHAKTGNLSEMERALDDGERLAPAITGRRQLFLISHARGFCLLSQGRYFEAKKELLTALTLGEGVGDGHVAAFDGAYLAEALIFLGEHVEASRRLEALIHAKSSGRSRGLALARKAYLEAILGNADGVRHVARTYEESRSGASVPFLDAWDALFLGWAFAVAGLEDEGLSRISLAERYFEEHRLRPALAVASVARAEASFLARDIDQAKRSLAPFTARSPRPPVLHGLPAIVAPLLTARILLEDDSRADVHASAADLLAEADGALVGNALPEWSSRVDALRSLLLADGSESLSAVGRRREEAARALPQRGRKAYLESLYWDRWVGVFLRKRRIPAPLSSDQPPIARPERTDTVPLIARGRPQARATLVTKSAGMLKVAAALDRLRGSDLSVLISGETGTGKELVARALHEQSPRWSGPFRVLDCATIPPALFETEVFGACRGAFTGLSEDRQGILADAQGGTVFVEEIGGAPLEQQAKLLRVLSSRMVRPVGGSIERKIDVRFLFSTSKDLAQEAKNGTFRNDLLHRIRVIHLELPPLRERPEDFPELVAALLQRGGLPAPNLGPGVIEKLRELPWPGNVRQLESVLARLRLECPRRITVEAIARFSSDPKTSIVFPRNLLAMEGLPSLKDRLEHDFIVYHFRRLGGDTKALCGFLGLGMRQLYRRCERVGLRLREERGKS